jgi:hypothetical protein
MQRDDVIRMNVPLFLRLIELVREEVKDDVPLHTLTEIAVRLSNDHVMSMADYENILAYMSKDGHDFGDDSYEEEEPKKIAHEDELDTIKRLGGM